jgi:hypothetical protein
MVLLYLGIVFPLGITYFNHVWVRQCRPQSKKNITSYEQECH